jgi:asparagine synthase (glutamine-hydrolysing)
MLCWDNAKQTSAVQSYSRPFSSPTITNINEAHAIISNALRAAVKRQLIADAPIGVFLSGGIDSSLLTLLAAEEKHGQLKTVSIFFNEKAYDEHAFQELVTQKITGQTFSHLIKQQEFDNCFPDIVTAMDMPTTDGINSWFISKYARQAGLKAVLSGLGGDELFGGYPSFKRINFIQTLQKLPAFLFTGAQYLLNDRYRKISYLSNANPLAIYLAMRAIFTSADIAKLLDCDEQQVNNELFGLNIDLGKHLQNEELASWLESNIYMQNQLLRDTDVMSMSHGLEVRVPFLDEDFQAAAHSIEPSLLFNKDQPKKILIDSFKNILPEAVWKRKKMGFSFPLQQWMRNHSQIADENFYSGAYAKRLIRDFSNDKTHWSKAFALYLNQLHA